MVAGVSLFNEYVEIMANHCDCLMDPLQDPCRWAFCPEILKGRFVGSILWIFCCPKPV